MASGGPDSDVSRDEINITALSLTDVGDAAAGAAVSTQLEECNQPAKCLESKMETQADHLLSSPRRGPTLSTSTSSFEALDPHDPNLSHLASLMFSHTSCFLQGELNAVLEDYSLLEQMNRATMSKYSDLCQVTASVGRSLDELNCKYRALQPYLDQIDQIEDSVTKLEAAAYKLDAYARRLEEKFKSLEKK